MLIGDLFGDATKNLTEFENDLVGFLLEWLKGEYAVATPSIVYSDAYQFMIEIGSKGRPIVSHRRRKDSGSFTDWTRFAAEHPLTILGRVFFGAALRGENCEIGEVR